jgi:hypothetical protein
MSEAIRFIWALINQWAALLTGGLIIAFLAAIERRCGRSISWRAFLRLAILLLFFACFLMWREQDLQLNKPITVAFKYGNAMPFMQPDSGGQLWIRMRAINIGANDIVCRVFLNKLEKIGQPSPIWANDNLELFWAGTEYEPQGNSERTIPASKGRIFNIAVIKKGANELSIQNQQFESQATDRILAGTYRFSIQASHSTCRSDPFDILVEYKGGQTASFIKN